MIYIIEAFDRESEFLVFEEKLPNGCDQELKTIMGWTSDQQGWEGYDLTSEQLEALERILGKKIHNPALIFQLSCNV
ncbi:MULTISPECIES: DUF7683 domain-containing protein [unclassified Pseudomonas]|jgi:hypothetical protein|uniref:DUF7683 domain-containing protein n=1 Tax=unclassified Pseudomonas TaxID=196821 RepID=UPI00026FE6DC|nr:hypothetical protein [Pseudomonas sp. GM48]EJM48384.1 hypothetical protein PMI28_05594 [Pseudomonas sp. GM48]